MTYKERLKIEHPEKVNSMFGGGCCDCPHTYGYEECSSSSCKSNGGKGCEYCWNREIPVDEFHVGDKVRLRKGLVVGKVYEGVRLEENMKFQGEYYVRGFSMNGDVNIGVLFYSPVMLEKVEERKNDMKKFTINDLKENMLLETRNGHRFLWVNGKPRNIDSYIGDMNDDLKHRYLTILDIVKVGYTNDEACTIEDMLKMDFSEVIWQEEANVKDVSLEEINALLKEKYPDVDKFNLPIRKEGK